jgi:hypothetical protein
LKPWYPPASLHGIITQKTTVRISVYNFLYPYVIFPLGGQTYHPHHFLRHPQCSQTLRNFTVKNGSLACLRLSPLLAYTYTQQKQFYPIRSSFFRFLVSVDEVLQNVLPARENRRQQCYSSIASVVQFEEISLFS